MEGNLSENVVVEAEGTSILPSVTTEIGVQVEVFTVEIRKDPMDGMYECGLCRVKFPIRGSIYNHVHRHRRERPDKLMNIVMVEGEFECDKCNGCFDSKETLFMHYATSHGPFICDVCHKSFDVRTSLKHHFRQHTEEKLEECQFCGDMFVHKINLKQHYIAHANEKTVLQKPSASLPSYNGDVSLSGGNPEFNNNVDEDSPAVDNGEALMFGCDICPRVFPDQRSLNKHSFIHDIGDCFECDICGKYFISTDELTRHLSVHTGEKPYQCTLCHKGFKYESNLLAHGWCHSKRRPEGGEQNKAATSQEQHFRDLNEDLSKEKPHECQICHKRFKLQSSLITHHLSHQRKQKKLQL